MFLSIVAVMKSIKVDVDVACVDFTISVCLSVVKEIGETVNEY